MLRHPLHEQKYYLHKRIILHGGMSDTLPDHKEFSYNVQLSCDVEIVLHQTVMVREVYILLWNMSSKSFLSFENFIWRQPSHFRLVKDTSDVAFKMCSCFICIFLCKNSDNSSLVVQLTKKIQASCQTSCS